MTGTTTDTAAHITAITGIYRAFAAGDIGALLKDLADDVSWDADWQDNFTQRAGVPMFTPRRGPAQVAEFFAGLASLDVADFQVLDFLASERQVAVQVVIEVAYPDGGRYRDEELHLWTFGADAKVTALRHYVDTAKHIAAAAGQDTTAR
jgi:ketosteroid isomerase-like protein